MALLEQVARWRTLGGMGRCGGAGRFSEVEVGGSVLLGLLGSGLARTLLCCVAIMEAIAVNVLTSQIEPQGARTCTLPFIKLACLCVSRAVDILALVVKKERATGDIT
jgi:hypothetical protein